MRPSCRRRATMRRSTSSSDSPPLDDFAFEGISTDATSGDGGPSLNGVSLPGIIPTMAVAERVDVPAAHLLGWDCIEWWVGNARTFAGFLMSAFGFECTAYAGPETGVREKASYVLEQGDIRFVVSGALTADSPIAAHVRAHGDGVHDLAW